MVRRRSLPSRICWNICAGKRRCHPKVGQTFLSVPVEQMECKRTGKNACPTQARVWASLGENHLLDFLGNLKRTHNCGELRAKDEGRDALVMPCAPPRRDLPILPFLDVRDRTG